MGSTLKEPPSYFDRAAKFLAARRYPLQIPANRCSVTVVLRNETVS
jgi:hypothetical protein